MKDKFRFDEEKHLYFLNGEKLTGVTTILGVIDKPALMPWAVGLAVEHLKKNPEDWDGAKKAYRQKRDKAADIGTAVHGIIEIFVGAHIDKNAYSFDHAYDEVIKKAKLDPEKINKANVEKMVDKFIEWSNEEVDEFLESEVRLYSKDHRFAGTADLVYRAKDGRIKMGDIKTAKGIYPINFVQMGGYSICLEENDYKHKISAFVVINIPKEFYKDGSAKLNVKEFYNIDDAQQTFLAALDIYNYQKIYK